jgi:acetyl-CoA carboxylase biotin carboxyl carrier protein
MDVERIKSLVDLMIAGDLSRLEIQEGDTHILLRRGQAPVVSSAAAPSPVAVPPPATALAGQTAGAAAPDAPGPGAGELMIRSPMVGTFYTGPDPESPAFVKPGDHVSPDTVVCLIEAMKVFNEIKAELSGRIVRCMVKNAEAVEFDQPLFVLARE